MSKFVVETLPPAQIRSVYPLMREAVPGLQLNEWLRFARRLTRARPREPSGIMVARQSTRSWPSGMVCFRRRQELGVGPVLALCYLVALDLLDPAAVVAALMAQLDIIAAQLGCVAIITTVHRGAASVTDDLFAAGHRPEGAVLTKPVGVSATSSIQALRRKSTFPNAVPPA
jgi:hypothetical protein